MLIEVNEIKKTYEMGDSIVSALRGVTLSIESGEFLAIMGPSGSGKSTLMHLLVLLDVPESGSYKHLGQEVSKLSQDELAQLRNQTIGFVFQQFNLLPRTSALENVILPLIYGPARTNIEKSKELLKEVGLGTRMYHKPNELSGGQQQRVAIARALVNNPKIIFADEPTGNLDSKSEEEIMGIFKKFNEEGITVILVTHEEGIAAYAKRIIRMRDGVIISDEKQKDRGENRDGALFAQQIGLRPYFPHHWFSFLEVSEHFKQAGRALLANKVRTALSMLGILIGVGAVIAMLALGSGAKESLEKQLSSMGTNLLVLRPGSRRTQGVSLQAGEAARFSTNDADEIISGIPLISKVAPQVSGRGQLVYGNKNWNTQIVGSVPNYASMRASVPVVGRFFTEEENQRRSRVVVVGQTIVRELFPDKNPLGEMIKINRINFKIVGILPEKGANTWRDQDDIVIIPLLTAMKRVLGKDYVDSIDIEVTDPNQMEEVQESVKSLVIKSHRLPPSQQESFEIRNMAEIQAALMETSRTMTMLLGSIATISLLVGGIGIMNIMLVSVTERTREIGLRKAVGARMRDIRSQFLIEAVVISVLGGTLGLLVGSGISFAMSHFAGWATRISLESVLLAFLFSSAVGIGFGFWPAKKAASLNPIDALRYE